MIETQPLERRQKVRVIQGQRLGADDKGVFAGSGGWQLLPPRIVAVEQLVEDVGTIGGHLIVGIQHQRRIGQEHPAVARRHEGQRAAAAQVQREQGQGTAADGEAARLLQLAVVQGDAGDGFHQLAQKTAFERDDIMLGAAVARAPQTDRGRRIQHRREQVVLQLELVFIGQPTQAAFQREPRFIVLVMEDQRLVDQPAQHRRIGDVLGQFRQIARRQPHVRVAQVDPDTRGAGVALHGKITVSGPASGKAEKGDNRQIQRAMSLKALHERHGHDPGVLKKTAGIVSDSRRRG